MSSWLVRLAGLALGFTAATAAAAPAVEVWRDPSCGCCAAWVTYLREHGYAVLVHEDAAMAGIKAKFGVPTTAASCHTARIGSYVVEGHVPVEDIQRLLQEHPQARGLAAPGMPMGSPGMDMGTPERYAVVLIGMDGSVRPFAIHGPGA